MKINEFRKKSSEELYIELTSLLREKFNLKMQISQGKSFKPHLLRTVRKNIIWIKTLLTEREKDI